MGHEKVAQVRNVNTEINTGQQHAIEDDQHWEGEGGERNGDRC